MEEKSYILKLSNSSGSVNSFENTDDNILARIKRLQIEENYIRQTLCKSITCNNFSVHLSNGADYYKFIMNTKESFRNVKHLFEHVKTNTSNQDALQSIDVDEIKITTLELEDKIKSLKKYLQTELINLQRSEEILKQNIRENPTSLYKMKGLNKLHSMSYNQIVPSPVKEIIHSTNKYLEVQEFQDFMTKSENRYGGWNEYYHNIFKKIWNYYLSDNFYADFNINLQNLITNVMDSDAFQSLLHELQRKFTAFTKDHLVSHCRWYLTYTYLKERQRIAIEKWKEKKHLIKNKNIDRKEKYATQKDTKCYSHFEDVAENTHKLSPSQSCKNINNENWNLIKSTRPKNRLPFTYTKPTKQWISRCQKINEYSKNCYSDLSSIRKLQVPKWRSSLQDNITF